MSHRQPRGPPHNLNNRRAAEDSTIPDTHLAEIYPQPIHEHGDQGQAQNQQTTINPLEFSPPQARSNPHIYPPRIGENRYRSALLWPPPSVTPLFPLGLGVGAHGQGSSLGGHRQLSGSVTQVPPDVAGSSQGLFHATTPPERRASAHPYNYRLRHPYTPREQLAQGIPEPSYTLHENWNGSAGSRSAPHWFNDSAPTFRGGRRGDQLPVIGGRVIPVLHPPHPSRPGPGPYAVADYASFATGGSLREPRGAHYNPYPRTGSYHRRQESVSTPTSTRPSGGGTDIYEYAGPPNLYGHSSEGTGGTGRLAELSQNLHSDGLPSPPTGVQRPRKGKRTKQPTDPDQGAPTQERAREKKPNFRDSMAQLRATCVIIRGPTQFIKVPQTQYKCAPKQYDWEEGEPIEFGGIKLIDAANPAYLDLHGRNDKVLNYEGVGSSISCRLNFPGRKVRQSKILATNNKKIREYITKEKLALEVSKSVWKHFEIIKAESGCADMTFENMWLVRLVRVSKGSWQPELWYEAPAPGLGPSY